MTDAITCQVCGKVSHHPQDVLRGYCAWCHGFTRSHPDETLGPPCAPDCPGRHRYRSWRVAAEHAQGCPRRAWLEAVDRQQLVRNAP